MPGTKPRKKNKLGICHQLSTACVLGLHWSDAPSGLDAKGQETDEGFWGKWSRELREWGYEDMEFHPNGKNEPEGLWLAVVSNGKNDGKHYHTVVMQGKKLYYDPNGDRKHRPHNIHWGYKLVEHGDN